MLPLETRFHFPKNREACNKATLEAVSKMRALLSSLLPNTHPVRSPLGKGGCSIVWRKNSWETGVGSMKVMRSWSYGLATVRDCLGLFLRKDRRRWVCLLSSFLFSLKICSETKFKVACYYPMPLACTLLFFFYLFVSFLLCENWPISEERWRQQTRKVFGVTVYFSRKHVLQTLCVHSLRPKKSRLISGEALLCRGETGSWPWMKWELSFSLPTLLILFPLLT